MKIDEVIIVHPKTHEQLNTIKAFMHALKIKFKITKKEDYNPDFVEKILESKKQFEEGKFTEIKQEGLKSFIDNL